MSKIFRVLCGLLCIQFLMVSGVFAQPRVPLAEALETNLVGNVVTLDGSTIYDGPAVITNSIIIEGNNALLEVDSVPGYVTIATTGGNTTTFRNLRVSSDRDVKFTFDQQASGVFENVQFLGRGQSIFHRGNGMLSIADSEFLGMDFLALNINPAPDCHPAQNSVTVTINNSTFDGLGQNPLFAIQANQTNLTLDGVTVRNAQNGVSGKGNFTVRNSNFSVSNTGVRYLNLDCGISGGSVTVDGLTGSAGFAHVAMDDQTTRIPVTIRNSTLTGGLQAIVYYQPDYRPAASQVSAPGSPSFILENTSITGHGDFALLYDSPEPGRIRNLTISNSRTGLFMKRTVLMDMEGLDLSLFPPTMNQCTGVTIGMRENARARIRNATIVGGLNSVDAKEDCHVDIADSELIDPIFSGLILEDGTTFVARRVVIRNPGQDSIFAVPITGNTVSGIVEDCVSINAGVREPLPVCGLPERAGSGMVFHGPGPFVVRNNLIFGSWDLGLDISGEAKAVAENNVIHSNRLTGVFFNNVSGDVTFRNNMIWNNQESGQAGIGVFGDARGRLRIENNLIASNRFGLAHRGDQRDTYLFENLFVRNLDQSASITGGTVDGYYNLFFENAGYQILGNINLPSRLRQGMIFSSSALGSEWQMAPGPDLRNNWWGHPQGPWNQATQSNPGGGRMGYRNASVNPFRGATHYEVYHRGLGVAPVHVSAGGAGNPWLVTDFDAGGWAGENYSIAAMRPLGGFATPRLAALDSRPVYFFLSGSGETIQNTVSLEFRNLTLGRPAVLARADYETGKIRSVHPAQVSGSTVVVSIVTQRPITGPHWFLPGGEGDLTAYQLVSLLSGLMGDANGDGVLDASDVVRRQIN